MKRILKNKWGVTLLEGVIALGLLSIAAAATFGVLLSVSRKSSRPDFQEEMLWAIERAHTGLQMYVGEPENISSTSLPKGLCGGDNTPLQVNTGTSSHTITCMLPAICDTNNGASSFTYTVSNTGNLINATALSATASHRADGINIDNHLKGKTISFQIECNGFTLSN